MKDYIKKLSEFKEIEPDEKWYHVNRAILINILENAGSTNRQGFQFKSLFFGFNIAVRTIMPSFKAAIITCSVLIMISGTVFGAQASMPGNFLYQVKTGMERVELILAENNTVKETNIRLNHASKRLEEIQYLVENNKPSKRIAKVSNNMKNNFYALKNNFNKIKDQPEVEKSKVIELAKLIDENSINTSQALRISSVDLSDTDSSKAINEVIKASESLGHIALEMIVSNENELKEDELELINDSLNNKIQLQEDRIDEIDDKIEQAKESLGQVSEQGNEEVGEIIEGSEVQETTEVIEFNINKIKSIESDPEKIAEYLENARTLLKDNDYSGALIEVEKAGFYIDITDKVLDDMLKDVYEKEIQELEEEINDMKIKGETEQVINEE